MSRESFAIWPPAPPARNFQGQRRARPIETTQVGMSSFLGRQASKPGTERSERELDTDDDTKGSTGVWVENHPIRPMLPGEDAARDCGQQ